MDQKEKSIIKKVEFLAVLISVFLAALFFLIQWLFVNPYAAGWDQVDFSLALNRYDLLSMQPHFPGYPYFILGAHAVGVWMANPPEALTMFNILMYTGSMIPIFLLSRTLLPRTESILAAAAVYSLVYVSVIVNQPMSEGAALAVFWWYFWSLFWAAGHPNIRMSYLPLFLLSALLGIRLSYLPFAAGVLYLFYAKWKQGGLPMKQFSRLVMAAVFFQMFWIGGLVLSEGSVSGLINLALGFTSGHFQEWGGAATAAEMPLLDRLSTFLFKNIFWTGVFSRSSVLMVLYSMLLLLFLLSFHWKKVKKDSLIKLAVILGGAYAIWTFIAQNIDKPRHIIPLAALIVFLLVAVVFSEGKRKIRLAALALTVVIIGVQVYYASGFIREQASKPPATYQLAAYLKEQEHSFVLYTWEETRVLEYLRVPFSHKRIFTYDLFLADSSIYPGRTVFLTDKVARGFEQQGASLDQKMEKVKEFHSNPLFDPVYHTITLYKWKNSPGGEQRE